ncbi:MAG TPA: 16S rRNA (uracil(1498)-N(3))-methyltransferase [Paludibacteraceae bacterium]|jgi:16S rRNA (uracil1498-N3)-methyltransferase|nr:16S rRNA (uracil(1498)-N(3))-methyltransferase [Paludibacteraceae bacterium]HOU67492.1 16S rRNA (uracil(1498)-N(3))-methyltransferase [Paludibacteraceae bacterium]HPH63314.1 16S rRNA (uracil(1498)-N(3))-methyltransferase [Paludibacteraceae bacterium]
MLFYTPNIEESPYLPEEESNHAIRVLRLQTGDKLELIDGRGGYYEAEILVPHHKKCEVKILNHFTEYHKRPFKMHVAIAPTKNMDRIEWFAEKVTEIGVDEITPVICRFSERKEIKHDRLEKILVSAMKQSKKAYLPKLNDQCTFAQFIQRKDLGQRFIAHCYEQDKKELSELYKPLEDATILIGPEGDFGEDEVSSAIKIGFAPVSLGESRLRTETAGVVACHTMDLLSSLK